MKEHLTTIDNFPYPDSTHLQRQVIADVINYPEYLLDCRRKIDAEMFTDADCRKGWQELCAMQDRKESIDLSSAFARLGQAFITEQIIPLSAYSGNIATLTHSNLLIAAAMRQKCYNFALSLLRTSTDNTASESDIIKLPEDFAAEIRRSLNAEADCRAISDILNNVAEIIQQERQERQRGRTTRIPTSIPTLDEICYGGFGAGQLIILAARPSIGKTAVSLSMARAAAAAGVSTMYFSLEMTSEELGQRLLLSTELVKPRQLISGVEDWSNFERAASQFDTTPMFVNDSSRTLDELCTSIILNSQQGKCRIAFIDYLGLIDNRSEGNKPLHQIIADTTKRLKQVAKDCRIPIVLLCQLNRASAADNRPPQLFDLRDSGGIEQDADLVLMLDRDTTNSSDVLPPPLRLWIRKNRQGKAGDYYIALRPNDTYTCFEDCGLMQV